MEQRWGEPRAGRVCAPGALAEALARARAAGARVVLTNGCFDLLHVGHLRYLEEAKRLGDVLVVGVNDDAAVCALKGAGRPLVPAAERAELVAALRPVDLVVIFEERTADALLRRVRPDVYVKGGDYRAETLPEAETAVEVGALVRLVALQPGWSSSDLVARIVQRLGSDAR